MENKLSFKEAEAILKKARENCEKCESYRLGQSIFNLLPRDLYSEASGMCYDFFYWEDDSVVLDVFYREYVNYEHT